MDNPSNKKKILVIDDDVNLNTVLVSKLNISGFEAIGATNGEEGIQKAFSVHPDIILLDLLMPGIDGLEVLKRLRQDQWGKQVKIIMLTLVDKLDAISDAVTNNASGYLIKTNYSLDQMVEEMKHTLANPIEAAKIEAVK